MDNWFKLLSDPLIFPRIGIELLLTWSRLYIGQASSSFKCFNTHTFMYTTPTFIPKAFHLEWESLAEKRLSNLANLANHQQFAKSKPSKLVVKIDNLIADLFIYQTFFAKVFIHPLSPNINAAKLSHYMVLLLYTCFFSYTLNLQILCKHKMQKPYMTCFTIPKCWYSCDWLVWPDTRL